MTGHPLVSLLFSQVLKRLEDFGDEDAQDIVGAFETKYSKLKDRYKVRASVNPAAYIELADSVEFNTMLCKLWSFDMLA